MAGIARFELALWCLLVALETLAVVLLLRKERWRTYPGLLLYLTVNILQGVFLFFGYSRWKFDSVEAKHAAWLSQIPVLCMRAWAIVDICRLLLSRYRGIWGLAWRLLTLLGTGLVLRSVLTAGHGWGQIVPNVNIGLEWTTMTVLVALFLFARHYEVEVSGALRAIALGFLLYSCFAILNDTVLSHWLARYSSTWNVLATLSFLASVCLWIMAVLRPLEETRRVLLLPRDVYHALTPELNLRLHNLNQRLIRLWNPEAHRQ